MKYTFDFVLAIGLTALPYFIGSFILSNGLLPWQALLIGASVVFLGAITEALKAPMWLILLVPFPIGMILLYVFLGESVQIWAITYLLTLTIYTIIHVFMSFLFKFHSLIPAWKLS